MRLLVFLLSAAFLAATTNAANLVCFYDSASYIREGIPRFTTSDFETALQFCTHVIYGYAGINPTTWQLNSLNENLDIQKRHFATITAFKERHPDVKFLLSVGGDKDGQSADKYMSFLEAGRQKQTAFVESARDMLRSYNFDGLDLAFQFPRNKPRKVHSDLGMAWKSFKKFFSGDHVVDEKAYEHREQFTDLIKDLRDAFRPYDLMLTLTVLPNVNASWYFNSPAIINNLDFINLATFDFLTPERNPEEADFTAPLYELPDQDRLPHYNVNYQLEHWLIERVPARKINIGIASYGRAWKLTKASGSVPVVKETNGAAPAGLQTKTPGLLNYAEICAQLPRQGIAAEKNSLPLLRRISDPTKRFGNYAFRLADQNGENGIWVSYDDSETAASKAEFVKAKNLGGVALFDMTLDDFKGECTGDKFPMLRAIKYRLL